MARSTFFFSAVATTAIFMTTAISWAADTTTDRFPDLKPGESTLAKATLPATTGGTWTDGDASPLGGPNGIDASKTETSNVWLFQPSDESAKSDAGFPLLLFLHGSGERGDNPERVKIHGPAKLCADPEKAKHWVFFTVSPQCPGENFWSPAQLIVLINQLCDRYPIDRSRIYVTGLSMGGYGTWGLVAASENLIAAAAPLCGGYDVEFAPKMTKTPIWAFHGDADGAVSYQKDRELVQAVRDAGNPDVQFTTYPGVGHDCWTRTYDNPELYKWFLSKKLEKLD